YKEYIIPYIARQDDMFGMGTSAGEVMDGLDETIGVEAGRWVNQAMLSTAGTSRADRSFIADYVSVLKAGLEAQKLHNDGKTALEIKTTLTAENNAYFADDGLNEVFRETAGRLADRLIMSENADAFYSQSKTFSLSNTDSVYVAVTCNDEPMTSADQKFWLDTAFAFARDVPVIDTGLANQPCIYWNRKVTVSKPAIDRLKDASLLLVQSEFDVPTPPQGAMATFEQLPAAHMVYVKDEGQHGVILYKTECVDLTVANYLLGTAPAQRLTECAGRPLPFEQPAQDNL